MEHNFILGFSGFSHNLERIDLFKELALRPILSSSRDVHIYIYVPDKQMFYKLVMDLGKTIEEKHSLRLVTTHLLIL